MNGGSAGHLLERKLLDSNLGHAARRLLSHGRCPNYSRFGVPTHINNASRSPVFSHRWASVES